MIYTPKLTIIVVIIIMMMTARVNTSPIGFLCCKFRLLFSYPDGRVEKLWPNGAPLSCLLLITYIFLHVNIQTGGMVFTEEGVIAKSLLQRTDKTPNLNALVKSQENIVKFNSFSVDKA